MAESTIVQAPQKKNDRKIAEGDMSVVEHLDELRTRILICLAAWGLAAAGVWFYHAELIEILKHPLGALGYKVPLVVNQVTEAFMIALKIALLGGLFLAAPVVLWQALLFVLPALTKAERRAVLSLVPFAILLFAGGLVFCYFLVLPTALRFLVGFGAGTFETLITASNYFNFVVSLELICGLIFQMPLIVLGLSFIGLIDVPRLIRYRRYSYFGCFVAAMLVTPTPDAFTMIVVALPMLLLYEVSIILVRLIKRPTPLAEES